MPDMEKVSYGLRCMCYGDVECKECPYAKDGSGWYGCRSNCAEDAIVLLKEQQVCENCAMAIEDRQLVRCKDCMKGTLVTEVGMLPFIRCFGEEHELDWFCADGEVKE